MISWHSAPGRSYKGYIYRPEVDEDEEGIRKATHRFVSRVDPHDVMICSEHSPYRWMTFKETKQFIDKMIKVRA